MKYKYARYVGFNHTGKYWIKYTDANIITYGNHPGIDAVGYSFLMTDGGIARPWLQGGFFPFDGRMKFFQEIKYKNLPKELKGGV